LLSIGRVIGIELIAGRHAEVHGLYKLTCSVLALIEESLEVAGVIIFVDALLVNAALCITPKCDSVSYIR
jgi:hypothetical protein